METTNWNTPLFGTFSSSFLYLNKEAEETLSWCYIDINYTLLHKTSSGETYTSHPPRPFAKGMCFISQRWAWKKKDNCFTSSSLQSYFPILVSRIQWSRVTGLCSPLLNSDWACEVVAFWEEPHRLTMPVRRRGNNIDCSQETLAGTWKEKHYILAEIQHTLMLILTI